MGTCRGQAGSWQGGTWLPERALSSLCPARDGDLGGMRDHHPGEPPSLRSQVGLGQWWHCHPACPPLSPPAVGCGGTQPSQGPCLSYLGGLGGDARFKSAAPGEAVPRAPAPRWKFPWKNNNGNDNNAIPCCQRAAVNQGGGGARSFAHLDVLTQPRGGLEGGGLRSAQSVG